MQYEFAFICDYAEQDRKLHAIGIAWDTIYAANLPYKHPVMSFVARLKGSAAERGAKDAVISLLGEDGDEVVPPFRATLTFDPQPNTLYGYMNIVVNLGGVEFKQYGSYSVRLTFQGTEMASVDFRVVQPPTTA